MVLLLGMSVAHKKVTLYAPMILEQEPLRYPVPPAFKSATLARVAGAAWTVKKKELVSPPGRLPGSTDRARIGCRGLKVSRPRGFRQWRLRLTLRVSTYSVVKHGEHVYDIF